MDNKLISKENEQRLSYLDMNARHEINQSIENLKNTLIDNLEKVLRRTSKDFQNVDYIENTGLYNEGRPEENCNISGRSNHLVKGTLKRFEEGSSTKDLACGYLKQRSSILKTVANVASKLSTSNGAEDRDDASSRAAQRQMRIWTDVAIDLDGYYLELLNRFLRTGRKTTGEMKGRTLLTHRLSESTIDDLNRNKRKQMFQSQHDIHDDVILGQLQEPLGINKPTVNDFIEDLLNSTNAKRQYAVCFFDNEAVSENEDETVSSKVDNCDEIEDWNESVGTDNEITDNETKDVRVDEVERQEACNFENVDVNFKEYVTEQANELENRKSIIEKLTEENLEMMGALENVEEYEIQKEKENERIIQEVKKEYESKFEEKNSEICELKTILSKVACSTHDDQGGEEYCLEGKVYKNWPNLPDYGKLSQCFEDACSQLKLLALIAKDCGGSITGKEENCSKLQLLDTASENTDNNLINWIIDQLEQLCKKIDYLEVNDENSKISNEKRPSKEIIDGLFVKLCQAAEQKNEMIREMEAKAKIFKQNFQKLKSQLMKSRNRLESLVEQTDEQEIQIAEKDEAISAQTEVLSQQDLELADLRTQNEVLNAKNTSLLEDLASAKEHALFLEEELKHSTLIEQDKCEENERLVEYLVNMEKIASEIAAPKKRITEQEFNFCKNCNAFII
ncbi:uncharacterized protein LOC135680792 [Rhopilema esculentum]|uniref:uncharacterized protein LOC135680792 n=1 Tax=Rhopilema esculentum TaxID=499914 RepID=UPI0031CFC6F9|eukprot:gene12874-3623_t